LIRARALAVIGRIRARRGQGDPWAPLEEALALIGPWGDNQDLSPVYAARSEAAWLHGDKARAREEARRGLAQAVRHPHDAWWLGETAFWAWRARLIEQLPEAAAQPYLLHTTGMLHDAALLWQKLGCPYHQAQVLADSAQETDLRLSLELAHALGAQPLARYVRERLRAMGASQIARGPHRSTRQNPFHLSDREVEVLDLLGTELSNAQIAERLVLSPKTVEHHVAAIFRKLGVHDRVAAGHQARLTAHKDR
jgi:DNA-binding CsgD family transcriptional regulator